MSEKIIFIRNIRGKNNMVDLVKKLRENGTSIEQMDKIAEKIISEFGEACYPTPIVEIAQSYGFKILELDFSADKMHGMIAISNEWKSKFGSDKLICIDEGDDIADKRFTIAHELGHYILDYPIETCGEYYEAYSKEAKKSESENRVNRFAASLLMPADIFKSMFNERIKHSDVYGVCEDLAKRFMVTIEAVMRRKNELIL